MLDLGFLQPIRRIVSHLPKQRQNLFFSATMPSEIGKLAGELLRDPVKVSVAPAGHHRREGRPVGDLRRGRSASAPCWPSCSPTPSMQPRHRLHPHQARRRPRGQVPRSRRRRRRRHPRRQEPGPARAGAGRLQGRRGPRAGRHRHRRARHRRRRRHPRGQLRAAATCRKPMSTASAAPRAPAPTASAISLCADDERNLLRDIQKADPPDHPLLRPAQLPRAGRGSRHGRQDVARAAPVRARRPDAARSGQAQGPPAPQPSRRQPPGQRPGIPGPQRPGSAKSRQLRRPAPCPGAQRLPAEKRWTPLGPG